MGQPKESGLDIEALEFLQMPSEDDEDPPTNGARMKGLTTAHAKEGLSIQFGLATESIQITISG